VKTVSDKVKAFIGLSVRTKMIGTGWERPLLLENLTDTDPPSCKTPIFNLFALVGRSASAVRPIATSSSAIAERSRCRVGVQKWKTEDRPIMSENIVSQLQSL